MLPFTQLVLTEFVGADAITCHFAYSTMPIISYPIRHRGPTDVAVVGLQGRITELAPAADADQVTITFHKPADYYAVLYRRRDFVTRNGDQAQISDSWPGGGLRYAAWFFPPGSSAITITPPTLAAPLHQWQGCPTLALETLEPQIAATYTMRGSPLTLPPAAADFGLARLLSDFAPPHGTEAEILCRLLGSITELPDLLAGAGALPALLTQPLALNLAAPGTLSLVQTA